MNKLTPATEVHLFHAVSVALLAVLISACSQSDGGSQVAQPEPALVLSSESQVVNVLERASTTLALSEQKSSAPGDTVDFVAFTYDADSEEPLSGGIIEFSAELESDDGSGTLQFPIGASPLIDGLAEIAWETPTDYFGDYVIRTTFAGDASIAPSEWQFRQHIARPDDAGAVRYAMARLNHIVNLMSPPEGGGDMLVDSVFLDGPDSLLQDVLADEFGLEILESYYRLQSSSESVVIIGDVETYLKSGGFNRTKVLELGLCVRTSFFLAANDDVLVLVIKGTDGFPNEAVNDQGSPARLRSSDRLLGGNDIAVHPGWAWMTGKLISGFEPRDVCGVSVATGAPYFPGLSELVNRHRAGANGEDRRLYVAGHSLGGALSRLAAVAMAADGTIRPRDRVYTFGAPWQGAYNTLLDFNDFEDHARAMFNSNGIELTTVEGYLDPIPSFPEVTAKKAWSDGISGFEDFLNSITSAACDVVNTVSGWFGVDADADCDISIPRPVGFERPPVASYDGFMSKSHFLRYRNGDIAVERCAPDASCRTAPESECQPNDISCTRLYHSTDVGGSDDPVRKRAHWVGDYEDNEKQRLRGDPTRYNFYYPASRRGDIRMPLEVIRLP